MDQLARTIPHFSPAGNCSRTGRASEPPKTGSKQGSGFLVCVRLIRIAAWATRDGAHFTETLDVLAEDDEVPMMDPCDPGTVGEGLRRRTAIYQTAGRACPGHARFRANCDCEDTKPIVYLSYKNATEIFMQNKYSR
jgi:hypothetical protein